MKPFRLETIAGISVLATMLAAQSSLAKPTPEEEVLKISKLLKPISDEDWKTIAGERTAESYEIVKGDTLYDISKRLFGENKYWPKIWALNNDSITNPHKIRPGVKIAFLPGTGGSLPAVGIGQVPASATATDAPSGAKFVKTSAKSDEWKLLPKQSWENVQSSMPLDVDKDGFDKRNKVRLTAPPSIELNWVASSDRLSLLGQIIGSRTDATYLTLGDTVFIKSDSELQVGDTYAITAEPNVLKSLKSDRAGYSYPVLGKVKIIGVRDGLFVGTLQSNRQFLSRGASLMTLPPRISRLIPIPGPSALEGVIFVDKAHSTSATAQHKQVFIDRGTDDGVQPGMVFRSFRHYDNSTESKITNTDFIISADILILQVSERFSLGTVLRSFDLIHENSTVVLLTDVSDLSKFGAVRERSLEDKEKDRELDNLDKLGRPEVNSDIGKQEAKELKQLENWNGIQGNPPESATELMPPAPPSDEPPLVTPETTEMPAPPPMDITTEVPLNPVDEPPPPPPPGEEPPAPPFQ